MKKVYVLATVVFVIVLMLSVGVNFVRAAEQTKGKEVVTKNDAADKDALMKEAERMITEGQTLMEKGKQMKEGTMDKATLIKEGNKMIEEGQAMTEKGKQTNDRMMMRNGKQMISNGWRIKQGWKNTIMRIGDIMTEKGKQMVEEGQTMMDKGKQWEAN